MMQHHPNIPVRIIMDMTQNTRCNLMPSLFNIRWHNIYWQEAKLSQDTTVFLYSAIYDNRKHTEYIDYQWMDRSREMMYLLTCRIPPSMGSIKPEAVSVVHTPCHTATNLLHVNISSNVNETLM
nr:uncharacterized protein LOC128695806 isoform X1 [Cherax quadricarinatus]